MVGTALERTRRFFNERAGSWDAGIAPETYGAGLRLVGSLGVEAGSRVLDVGCGTGLAVPWLLEAVGEGGRVTALDLAEGMLEVARNKHGRPNVRYVHGAIEAAPFAGGSFDEALCHNCFLHLADKERALGEIHRVLKPGGRVLITHTESRDSVNRWHRAPGDTGDLLPGERVMRKLLADAGFGDILIDDGTGSYVVRARKEGGWAAALGSNGREPGRSILS